MQNSSQKSYKTLKYFTIFFQRRSYKIQCNFQIQYGESPSEQRHTFQSRGMPSFYYLFPEIWFMLQFCKRICRYIWGFFPYLKFLLKHIASHFSLSFLVSVFSSQDLKRLLDKLLFNQHYYMLTSYQNNLLKVTIKVKANTKPLQRWALYNCP